MKATKKCVLIPYERYERLKFKFQPESVSIPLEIQKGKGFDSPPPPPGIPNKKQTISLSPQNELSSWADVWKRRI